MKISNETKVGSLTAIAITMLILGFNFLKGKSLFKTGNFLYAKVKSTKGLMVSNPVFINGLQVGAVYEMQEMNKSVDTILIAIKLSKELNIPDNSIATIQTNPLGSSSMSIDMGTTSSFLKNHDTLRTQDVPGTLEQVQNKLVPIVDQAKVTLQSLDSLLRNINSVFDRSTKVNMQQVVTNLNDVTKHLIVSSIALQKLMNQQNSALNASLNNVQSFTGSLAKNNEKITSTISNIETATKNISSADISGTIGQLSTTVERLNTVVAKLDSKDGSIGRLLNDNQLYDNLTKTTRSLNILMDDIRVNPKRYVSISIFGGKSNKQYLTSPLPVPDSPAVSLK